MNEPLRLWHVLLFLAWIFVPVAFATDTDIAALPDATSVATTDSLECNQSNTSRECTVAQIATGISKATGGIQTFKLGSDYTNSTTTGTEITGIGPMTVTAAGTYYVECFLMALNATAANGGDFGVNYTGTVTEMIATTVMPTTGTTAINTVLDGTVTGDGGALIVGHGTVATETTTAPNLNASSGFTANTENVWIDLKWLVTVSDTGDLEIWAASEAATQLTVQSGSFCRVTTL